MAMTAGEKVVRDNFPPWGKAKKAACALAIDTAIAAAHQAGFRSGFEHAVAGGEEANGFFKERGMLPLVLYFKKEADRNETIDAIHIAKPGLVEAKVPERVQP